jgi:hypothetical protein
MTLDPKRPKSCSADARSSLMLLSTAGGKLPAAKASQAGLGVSHQVQLVDGSAEFAGFGPANGGSVTVNIVAETGQAVRWYRAGPISWVGLKYFFGRPEKNIPPFAVWSGTLWA